MIVLSMLCFFIYVREKESFILNVRGHTCYIFVMVKAEIHDVMKDFSVTDTATTAGTLKYFLLIKESHFPSQIITFQFTCGLPDT